MTIELRRPWPPRESRRRWSSASPRPRRSDLFYARTGDQDDVVLIDAKSFRDLGLDPRDLRSKKVAEIDPGRVEFVRVEAFGRTCDLACTADGLGPAQPDPRAGRRAERHSACSGGSATRRPATSSIRPASPVQASTRRE